MTERIKIPPYLLESESVSLTDSSIKDYEKKKGDPKQVYPYLKQIPENYLNNPEGAYINSTQDYPLKSTGTQLRYLYNDKDFKFKDIIEEKPQFKYTAKDIDIIYKNKCKTSIDENIQNIKKIIAIGDIHGDFKQLIYILCKYNIIKKADTPKQIIIELTDEDKNVARNEDTPIVDSKTFIFEYDLNTEDIDNIIVIQVGDQLTGYRKTNEEAYKITKFNDKEDEKVLVFMDYLRERAKTARETLGKNIYIKSLIGNHEFTNLRGIYSNCNSKDNSCIEYFTNPELRKDRRAFIKNQIDNLLCNRDYFFTYNGIVFAHSGIINSVLLRLNDYFPHLDIINNLKSLNTLEEKIDYYNKLVKSLIYIKITQIKDDDIELKSDPKKLFNSIDNKAFADLANSKAAINDMKTGDNTKEIYNLFHLSNMVVGHDMIYNGIDKKIYIMDNDEVVKIYNIIENNINVYVKDESGIFKKVDTITEDNETYINDITNYKHVDIYNIDTGSNSFVGINKETKTPDFTFPDRNNKGKRISPPGFKNQLLKQVLIININDDNMEFNYETIEKIDTTQPYVKQQITPEHSSKSIINNTYGHKIYDE